LIQTRAFCCWRPTGKQRYGWGLHLVERRDCHTFVISIVTLVSALFSAAGNWSLTQTRVSFCEWRTGKQQHELVLDPVEPRFCPTLFYL
jgi:hypothetical protein